MGVARRAMRTMNMVENGEVQRDLGDGGGIVVGL
jgi:hypothetical protein